MQVMTAHYARSFAAVILAKVVAAWPPTASASLTPSTAADACARSSPSTAAIEASKADVAANSTAATLSVNLPIETLRPAERIPAAVLALLLRTAQTSQTPTTSEPTYSSD